MALFHFEPIASYSTPLAPAGPFFPIPNLPLTEKYTQKGLCNSTYWSLIASFYHGASVLFTL